MLTASNIYHLYHISLNTHPTVCGKILANWELGAIDVRKIFLLELFPVEKLKVLKSLLYKFFMIKILKNTFKPELVLSFSHFWGLIPNNSIVAN